MMKPETGFPRLAQPALRALAGAGITHIAQLAAFRESDIARLHGIGPNALKSLREALSARGLSFRKEETK
jgi:hypothetical protein